MVDEKKLLRKGEKCLKWVGPQDRGFAWRARKFPAKPNMDMFEGRIESAMLSLSVMESREQMKKISTKLPYRGYTQDPY